tara:strand:+ start:634 stop:1239 length:606 start_codon:yes stop_codon:yes gene_type:complete
MSGVTIKNPGTGRQAYVSKDGQLLVQSENLSLQHFVSRYTGQAYQVQFTDAGLTAKENVVGHIKNTSPTLSLVATYLRFQVPVVAGGTALNGAVVNNWRGYFGRTYVSGGTTAVPVNMNRSSGNAASVTAYQGDPVVSAIGTGEEWDRYYPTDNGQGSYNKEGALILGPNDTLSLVFNTDNTSGTAYLRLTFLMMDLSDLR